MTPEHRSWASLFLASLAAMLGGAAVTRQCAFDGYERTLHSNTPRYSHPTVVFETQQQPRVIRDPPRDSTRSNDSRSGVSTEEEPEYVDENAHLRARVDFDNIQEVFDAELPTEWGDYSEQLLSMSLPQHLAGTGASLESARCREATCMLEVRLPPDYESQGVTRRIRRWLTASSVNSCYHGIADIEDDGEGARETLFFHCVDGRYPSTEIADEALTR